MAGGEKKSLKKNAAKIISIILETEQHRYNIYKKVTVTVILEFQFTATLYSFFLII